MGGGGYGGGMMSGGMMGGGMMGGGMMGGGMMNNGYGNGYNRDDGYDRSDRNAYNRSDHDDYDGQHMGNESYSDHYRGDSDRMGRTNGQYDNATRQLQQEIRDKRSALDDELNQAEPNSAKAKRLQKELSQLQAQYDQKMLKFRLESRKNSSNTPD